MEEYVVYIPNLESLFYEKKELQGNFAQVANDTSYPCGNIIYLHEERKLYLRSVAFGTLEFQFVLLDFEHSKIIFKRKGDSVGDANRQIYELLSSLQWEFQPKKMTYVMERRAKQNYEK